MGVVVHVIPQASRGGASRALLTAVAAASGDRRHRAISLRPAAEEITERFEAFGLPLVDAPPPERIRDELERADIVHVHFWNSPELYELLRAPLPPMRLVVWCHIGGNEVPQVMLPELVELADLTVASSPYTAALPVLAGTAAPLIEVVAEPGRLGELAPRPHEGLAIGYVGTVDPVKMHPDFVELSAAVDVPGARFVVCGPGDGFTAIAREAETLGARDRFDLRGYVADVAPVLAELDVFGYPLCAGNYSACELVLQEAMHAGVPPVVLPHGGAASTVTDGETGIVAADERAYVAALERLASDRELRGRLAAGARAHARRRWSIAGVGAAWSATYDQLLEAPKRARSWPGAPAASGAELFVAALGGQAEQFRVSHAGSDLDAALEADEAIAAAPLVLAKADGGVLDYRRRYPDDPHLRLWAGLVLRGQGRNVLAAGELSQALRLGCDPRRTSLRLAAITEELGHTDVAAQARAAGAAG